MSWQDTPLQFLRAFSGGSSGALSQDSGTLNRQG